MSNVNDAIIREITPLTSKNCLYVADRRKTSFTYPIHYHDECELNFVSHAAGVRRVVGDSSEIISQYDLVLITSPELEHAWEETGTEHPLVREVTIQFSMEVLEGLIGTNSFAPIKQMFDKARNGISFPIDAIMKVYGKIDTISELKGFYAFVRFLEILHDLSHFTDEAKSLSSSSFAKLDDIRSDSRRVRLVEQYINSHYQEVIRLDQLSQMVGMSSVAFSRFFKLRTGKSLTEYISDIRIGHAARMLVDTTTSISEICYACGFNNQSNFNRIFKKKKDCSPKEFRENYRKKKVII